MMLFNNKLLVAVLTMATMVTYSQAQDLLKTDPEVIKLCDKNGDGVLKGKNEGLCYLDLKKKKVQEERKKIQEDTKKLQKIKKILSNSNEGL